MGRLDPGSGSVLREDLWSRGHRAFLVCVTQGDGCEVTFHKQAPRPPVSGHTHRSENWGADDCSAALGGS